MGNASIFHVWWAPPPRVSGYSRGLRGRGAHATKTRVSSPELTRLAHRPLQSAEILIARNVDASESAQVGRGGLRVEQFVAAFAEPIDERDQRDFAGIP